MMHIDFYGKNIDLTPALKQYVEEKLERLEKYAQTISYAKVTFERSKHHRRGEIATAHIQLTTPKGEVSAKEEAFDFRAAVDLVQEKLERQFGKKTK